MSMPASPSGPRWGKCFSKRASCAGAATRQWGFACSSHWARALPGSAQVPASAAGATWTSGGGASTSTPAALKACRNRSATPSGRSAPGNSTASRCPAPTSWLMPTAKKSRVRARSASVKASRLGCPVVPDVCSVTIRCTSPCETHKKSPQLRRASAVVKGRRSRSSTLVISRSHSRKCLA